jgi:hypothetical protein
VDRKTDWSMDSSSSPTSAVGPQSVGWVAPPGLLKVRFE